MPGPARGHGTDGGAYEDEYWVVEKDEETGRWGICHFSTDDEAYQVYLSLPRHLVDEDEAFSFAEANSEG